MGCGNRWLKRMEFYIKNTRFTILINGETGVFSIKEPAQIGGSPILFFLFFLIITMEDLDSMMRIASYNNWIRGFRVGNMANEVMEITHLQCVDDTVVFCESNHEQICYLRVIQVVSEACYRLKVNQRKIIIFSIKEV